ncbi:hypothetical protein DLM75_23980, partial [Leptospira stimsonii]
AISKDGVKYCLGSFKTAEVAAMMYDKVALALNGNELAKTNKALGLIQYKRLPLTPIEFKVHKKGRNMRGAEDRNKVKSLRTILKPINRFYGYTEMEKMLKYISNTSSRFIWRDRSLRSDAVEFLYSALNRNRKALGKVRIKITA